MEVLRIPRQKPCPNCGRGCVVAGVCSGCGHGVRSLRTARSHEAADRRAREREAKKAARQKRCWHRRREIVRTTYVHGVGFDYWRCRSCGIEGRSEVGE